MADLPVTSSLKIKQKEPFSRSCPLSIALQLRVGAHATSFFWIFASFIACKQPQVSAVFLSFADNTVFLSSPDLWLFQSSCPLFCDGPWALWGGSGGNIDVLVIAERSVVSFCLNHHSLYKETFPLKFERCANLWIYREEFRLQFDITSV